MDVSLTIWFAVLGMIVVMLAIDLVARRDAHVITAPTELEESPRA